MNAHSIDLWQANLNFSRFTDIKRKESNYAYVKRIKGFLKTSIQKIRTAKLLAQIKIIMFFRKYLAKNILRELRRKKYILDENFICLNGRGSYGRVRGVWGPWIRGVRFSKGLACLGEGRTRGLYKKLFLLWVSVVDGMEALELRSVIVLQSAFRMYMVRKYVLNYYSWRRGLCRLQAIWRRRQMRGFFNEIIFLYRCARTIQRIARGYSVRTDLNNRRSKDVHYASRRNNYQKLVYYVENYPDLVWTLDEEGNTALHNAARGAAKRTLKLLIKFGLELNVLNNDGYAPIHLSIISNAIGRDICCTYMLDVGFDEKQVTNDGKSCLLLACEHDRPVLARYLSLLSFITHLDIIINTFV